MSGRKYLALTEMHIAISKVKAQPQSHKTKSVATEAKPNTTIDIETNPMQAD